jgi:hypothetical protein
MTYISHSDTDPPFKTPPPSRSNLQLYHQDPETTRIKFEIYTAKMNPSDQQARPPTQTGAGAAPGGTSAQSGGGGDMLDKGVNFLEQKSGHEQKPGTTEKVC